MMKPPTRMKATSTVTLMATMTLLTFADSETPMHEQAGQHGADQEGRQVEQTVGDPLTSRPPASF